MITLEEIAKRLGREKENSFSRNRDGWEPRRSDNYKLPEFNIVESNAKGAKAKLKTKLSKVLAFIDSVKYKRFKDGCTIMPISVTNKDNLAIWGNNMNISRAVDYMIEIGLLGKSSEDYQFGAYYEEDNKSKFYYYYKENEDKVKEFCEKNGITKFVVQNKIYSMSGLKKIHKDIDKRKVRFSSKMKLIKPVGISKEEFQKQLSLCLYENYPGLETHIKLANEINEKFYKDNDNFRIRFEPNFTWSKDGLYIKSIGIRATNSMVSIKKEKRFDLLKAHGFTLEKDINASVPRMTLSLNKGYWIDETEDIYGLIYQVMEPGGELNEEMREAIKTLHMRAYFDSSDGQVGHHTWLSMDREGIYKQEVCDKMVQFRNAIIEAEGGKLYGNDIFYVESCVYLMTLYDLLMFGHKVWQVYDCFYSTGIESQETFEKIVSMMVGLNFQYFIDNYWNK